MRLGLQLIDLRLCRGTALSPTALRASEGRVQLERRPPGGECTPTSTTPAPPSDEHYAGVRTEDVKRPPKGERNHIDYLKKSFGTPWQPNGRQMSTPLCVRPTPPACVPSVPTERCDEAIREGKTRQRLTTTVADNEDLERATVASLRRHEGERCRPPSVRPPGRMRRTCGSSSYLATASFWFTTEHGNHHQERQAYTNGNNNLTESKTQTQL